MKYIQALSVPEILINLSEIKNQSFEELFIDAIDRTFLKLGEETKHSVYSLLEVDYKLGRKDIPNRLEDFVNALEQIFGVSARIIEIHIMREIHQKYPSFRYKAQAEFNFELFLTSLKISIEKLVIS